MWAVRIFRMWIGVVHANREIGNPISQQLLISGTVLLLLSLLIGLLRAALTSAAGQGFNNAEIDMMFLAMKALLCALATST